MMRAVTAGLLAAVFAVAAVTAASAAEISAAGSTALLPLMKAAASAYSARHPDVNISVSGGGSSTGITQVATGAVEIGDSDIPAKGVAALRDHRVAVSGFAVVTHPGIRLRSLSRAQLVAVFSGQMVNWRELGGSDQPIVVINRPRSSGTRAVFRRTIMQGASVADSGLTVDASGTVVATVRSTPGSVSYVALSALANSKLRPLAIDGVDPTVESIGNGRYPLWAYEHLFTNGEPSPDVAAFIRFVAENRALLRKLGYIPVDSMHVVENDR